MHPSIAKRRNVVSQAKIARLEETIRGELSRILEVVKCNDVLNTMFADEIMSAIASVETTDPTTPEGQEIRRNISEYMNNVNAVCRTILEDR